MLIISILGIIVTVGIAIIGFYYRTEQRAKAYYSIRWNKSSSLKLKDFLKERPSHTYYYQRPEDELIVKNLAEKKNTLIVGPPLSGKTRAVYQALISPITDKGSALDKRQIETIQEMRTYHILDTKKNYPII